jgi:hypothetical protein
MRCGRVATLCAIVLTSAGACPDGPRGLPWQWPGWGKLVTSTWGSNSSCCTTTPNDMKCCSGFDSPDEANFKVVQTHHTSQVTQHSTTLKHNTAYGTARHSTPQHTTTHQNRPHYATTQHNNRIRTRAYVRLTQHPLRDACNYCFKVGMTTEQCVGGRPLLHPGQKV